MSEQEPSPQPAAPSRDPYAVFNSQSVYDTYVRPLDDNHNTADLIVNGIHCAGCVRAIERGLVKAGADDVQVNFGNHRASIRWDERQVRLGDLLKALSRMGYDGYPYDPETHERLHRRSFRMAITRLAVAGFGAGNVMMYSVPLYAGYFYGMDQQLAHLFEWISALITVPVMLFSGWPFLRGAWGGLRNGRFNMDSLISLGIVITFIYSWVTLLAFPEQETYFDSVTMIIFFLLIGRTLESMAKGRSGSITERLMGLQVKWAVRLEQDEDGKLREVTVPIDSVVPGDRLLVRHGDTVPVDGEVLEGETELDESALTGESVPRFARPGDAVYGGTVNTSVPVVVLAGRVGAQTALARICSLVEQAQNNKAPLQRLADRIASHFVSVILVVAAATYGYWEWIHQTGPAQLPWITAISVLIIACPCALGLATPVAVLVGSALAAARGILIKGGEVLEQAAHVTDVVLDKTGTLTRGSLEVTAVRDLGDMPRGDWYALAGALERQTVHPIAAAMVDWLEKHHPGRAPDSSAVQQVRPLPGKGASGLVTGRRVVVGNESMLLAEGLEPPPELMEEIRAQKDTLVFIAVDGRLQGLVSLSDPLRPDALEAVAALQALGLKVHLFSGDREPVVKAVAALAGIDDARAQMLPDHKLEALRALQAEGRVVAMVGDGVNDAPALTQADLAVAVGTGSDIALESAQVILTRSRLLGMVETMRISRRTFRVIRENIGLSIAYNVIAVPLAMAGLVIPLVSAIAMSSSSLLVVGNAILLRLWGRRELGPELAAEGGGAAGTKSQTARPDPQPAGLT